MSDGTNASYTAASGGEARVTDTGAYATQRPKPAYVEINYRELDTLIGRLLTLNDVFGGSEKQIRSRKTLIQRECRDWLDDLAVEQKVEGWR